MHASVAAQAPPGLPAAAFRTSQPHNRLLKGRLQRSSVASIQHCHPLQRHAAPRAAVEDEEVEAEEDKQKPAPLTGAAGEEWGGEGGGGGGGGERGGCSAGSGPTRRTALASALMGSVAVGFSSVGALLAPAPAAAKLELVFDGEAGW